MNLLLDTCTFLWLAAGSSQMSARARELAAEPGNRAYLSVVSAWEIAVKYHAGRLRLPDPPSVFISRCRTEDDLLSLPLDEESVLHVAKLPPVHNDPFDRMLICQALIHSLVILTPDEQIARYPVRTIW